MRCISSENHRRAAPPWLGATILRGFAPRTSAESFFSGCLIELVLFCDRLIRHGVRRRHYVGWVTWCVDVLSETCSPRYGRRLPPMTAMEAAVKAQGETLVKQVKGIIVYDIGGVVYT